MYKTLNMDEISTPDRHFAGKIGEQSHMVTDGHRYKTDVWVRMQLNMRKNDSVQATISTSAGVTHK